MIHAADDMCRWQYYPLSMYECVLERSTRMETSFVYTTGTRLAGPPS